MYVYMYICINAYMYTFIHAYMYVMIMMTIIQSLRAYRQAKVPRKLAIQSYERAPLNRPNQCQHLTEKRARSRQNAPVWR